MQHLSRRFILGAGLSFLSTPAIVRTVSIGSIPKERLFVETISAESHRYSGCYVEERLITNQRGIIKARIHSKWRPSGKVPTGNEWLQAKRTEVISPYGGFSVSPKSVVIRGKTFSI